jgi:hypothetical protein
MDDERFEVFALDELEKLEAGAVEEIVAWHGIIHNVEDGDEVSLLSDLFVIKFILKSDTLSEEFERS